MNKRDLSERDICTKLITPAILQAGWQQSQFREEVAAKRRVSLAWVLRDAVSEYLKKNPWLSAAY